MRCEFVKIFKGAVKITRIQAYPLTLPFIGGGFTTSYGPEPI